MPMPYDDEEVESDEDDEGTGDSEFDSEASVALDPKAPMGERMMALKEAIRICTEKDYGDKGGGKKSGGGPGIALLLSPKGKR